MTVINNSAIGWRGPRPLPQGGHDRNPDEYSILTARGAYNETNYMMTMADDNPMPTLPELTRRFPKQIEFLLPLRLNARHYDEDGGAVPIFKESPETDENQGVSGEMYAMTIRPAICGHAAYVKIDEESQGFMQVCEPVYEHVNADTMQFAIRAVTGGRLKWINRYESRDVHAITPPNQFISRTAVAYQSHLPLSVYTNVAVLEAANYSSDSNFWRNLYPPMELIDCNYGLDGLLYDNNVLSMGTRSGSDESADIELRKPVEHERGFVDVCFTPQSKGAGRVRLLAMGVSIRVMTSRTISLACRLMSVVEASIGTGFGDWVLRCMGFTTSVQHSDVTKIVSEWKKMCEYNMPTVHVFEKLKVVVISISSGVLIRPVRTLVKNREFVREGPFVDSMCVHHSDTMRYLDSIFPDPGIEPKQFMCTAAACVDFIKFSTEPRDNLGIQMGMQGLNAYPVKGDATMTSLGDTEPIIKTDVLDAIMSKSDSECKIVSAGRNVVTAFINRKHNFEDACSIFDLFANMGSFAWMGYIDYPIPRDAGRIEPGMVLENEPWWKPAMKGLITRVFTNKSGGLNAVVAIYSERLEIGDKLATRFGIKFTLGEKMTYDETPTLMDEKTGEVFKPNLLIQTKNLTRGIGGQIRHMRASIDQFSSVQAFRMGERPRGKTVLTDIDELQIEPKLPSAYLLHKGRKVEFEDSNGTKRTVKCNYGIMRVMQLRHKPALKQHYPSTPTNSISVTRGRYRGGTPRTGETELLSMMMAGAIKHTSEVLTMSDCAIFDACSVCEAIPYFCDCEFPKPDTTERVVRYSAMQLNTYATIAMLNDGNPNPMTIRYRTST